MSEERFAFGRNWRDFIDKNLSEERIGISQSYMLDFLDRDNLEGLSLLDIGCGSGLHSLAAIRAGADEVLGFDYDQDSVDTTKLVKQEKTPAADNWRIEQGSVLDKAYLNSLGQYDLVYSWGVLHHTGDQWNAIRNAGQRVKPGGLFYIALYSADAQIDPPPEFWLDVKQRYIKAGRLRKFGMEIWYLWRFSLGKNPRRIPGLIKTMREYRKSRGMSYMIDVRDWLGGWPMEFSHDEDVLKFCRDELSMELVKIKQGEANTEYLFRRAENA